MISQTYPHLMSPLTIRGKVLKNRMLNSKCAAYQANELELAGDFYENLARNGAATVTMSVGTFPDCEGKRSPMSRVFMDDPAVQDKYREMIERVHKHGSLCSASLMGIEPQDVAISDVPNWEEIPMTGDYSVNLAPKPGISAERLQGMIDDFVSKCIYIAVQNPCLMYQARETVDYTENALNAANVWSSCDDLNADVTREYPDAISLDENASSEYNAIMIDIATTVSEYIARFVTGEYNMEGDWDVFIGRLEGIGIDRCTELKQVAYDRYITQ